MRSMKVFRNVAARLRLHVESKLHSLDHAIAFSSVLDSVYIILELPVSRMYLAV